MEPENPLNNPSPASAGEETSLPDPSAMGLSPAPKKKNSKKGIIIGAAAAVVVLLLIVLAVSVVGRSSSSNATQLQAKYDEGFKKGKAEAESAAILQQTQDTYVYKGASEFGNFELPIPKSWSFSVTPDTGDGTFLAIADPDYINTNDKTHVFSFNLKTGDFDKIVADYDAQTKKIGSDIKGSDATVSGIKGRRYVGTFDAKTKTKSEIVVLPYREKVLIIKTDNPDKYSAAFNKVLEAIKLNQ